MKINLLVLINFISLSLLPYAINGQILPLGTSTTFAVFTAVGEINSTGPTVVTGDIGTDVGAYNGFPPGIVQGGVYNADPISALAALDVQIAYASFATIPCDSVIGTTLGDGQILTPNVYCLGAASSFNGNLTLDAEGNSDAIFIFKINGAFSTSVLANLILVNSTSICNVYWQVNGQFTLGDLSNFYGTVINNGAINLLDGSIVEGRVLSVAGAVTLSNALIENVCSAALPIKLISFSAQCKNQEAHLTWATANEINNDYFSVERSTDTKLWYGIGEVDGSGNSSANLQYTFIDQQPSIHSPFYRFKQVDFDGQQSYSNIVNVRNCTNVNSEVEAFPNPTAGKINLDYKDKADQFISLTIYNSLGESIYHSINLESVIDLTNENNGIYLLHIDMLSGLSIKKFMIGS